MTQVGGAINVVFGAGVAWIVAYWVRKLGREPEPDELEPHTRAWADEGSRISAADYLLAVQDLQAFSRTVARFFTEVDVWLTPTLGEPPLPLAEAASSASFIGVPGLGRERHRQPGDVRPALLERGGIADWRPLPRSLRR